MKVLLGRGWGGFKPGVPSGYWPGSGGSGLESSDGCGLEGGFVVARDSMERVDLLFVCSQGWLLCKKTW